MDVSMKLCACCSIVFALFTCCLCQFFDISGSFCRGRVGGDCCPGRNDYCTAPILGTLCYCDIFCNRTTGSDCCPDFWAHCIGVPPPEVRKCIHEGRTFDIGENYTDNCNTCTCRNLNQQANIVCDKKPCLIRPELIERINKADYKWKATNYSFLWGKTLEEGIKHRLGTFPPTRSTASMTEIHYSNIIDLPENFDSRLKWPRYLQGIQDQGDCAASWAFSSTGLASDRLAVMSRGSLRVNFSPQLLISCQSRGQTGCSGGHLDRAWWFLRKHGTSSEWCYPYESSKTLKAGECKVKRWRVPGSKIPKVLCVNGEEDVLYLSTPAYRAAREEAVIMQEIYVNGPVQATFKVKEDFYSYRAGIYRYSRLSEALPEGYRQEGWHSVRIIGWGVSMTTNGPVKYWLCANSWGEQWGEGGYFRIERGTNECEIESFVVGVWANMEEYEDKSVLEILKSRGLAGLRSINR